MRPLSPSDTKPCARCGRPRRNKGGLSRLCRDCQGMGWPLATPTLDWKNRAECRVENLHDPNWWWPDKNLEPPNQFAIEVCGRCPVRAECLAYAIDRKEQHGIWGGLLPAQRFQLAKANKRGKK